MKRSLLSLTLLCLALGLGPRLVKAAPDEQSEKAEAALHARLVKEARENSQVMAHLKHLSETIGPRLTGSDGIDKAYAWTLDRFKSYGLEVKLEEWGQWPVGFNRGPWSGKMISSKGEKSLTFGTQSWTAGTKGKVRGKAVLAPKDQADFNKRKDQFKGAWVVSRNMGFARSREARALYQAVWEAGIAGWVRPVRGELIVTGGRYQGLSWDKLPNRVQVNLINSQWKELLGLIEAGEAMELEFDIQNNFKKGPVRHFNVVADLKGSEKPEEVVIVGGHIDSWDGAQGTTDNGTGVATTLEAARILTTIKARPKRTIRFILWSGEEQGLLGSRAYVRKHRDEMAKISGVLVHDGGTNTCLGITSTDAMYSQMQKAFAHILKDGHEQAFEIRKVDGLRGGGSDHQSYLGAGVPGFFWIQKGKAVYNYTHHTQHDKYDQAIEAYQKRSAEIIAAGALGIANLPDMLSRTKLIAPMRGRRQVLGVQLDGLKISTVSPGSIAEKAGFRPGDRIIKGAGRPIASLEWLRAVIRNARGKTVFVVERGGKELELTAVFPEGRRRRKVLGVNMDQDGVTITGISPGSIAEEAGLKAGDVFVRSGDLKITGMDSLRKAIQGANGPTEFVVTRAGKSVKVIAKFPSDTPKPKAKAKRKLY